MDNNEMDEARELAERAAAQAAHASKNTGRAVRAVAEPVIEHAAGEIAEAGEKLEGTAEDALHAVRKVNPQILGRITGDIGVGFLALTVAIWGGAVAYDKFRGLFSGGAS